MTDHKKRLEKLELSAHRNTSPAYDLNVLGKYLSNEDLALIEQASQITESAEQDYQADHQQPNGQERAPAMKALFVYMSDANLVLLEQAAEILERADCQHKAETGQGNGNGHSFKPHDHGQKIQGRPWKK